MWAGKPVDQPTIRVGLLWHSMNSDNLGVGAMTLGHIAIVQEVAARLGLAVRFLVLGWADVRPHYQTRESIEVRGLRLADFARLRGGFVSALRRCDVVLDIGAGDSFSDLYGAGRAAKILQAQLQVLLSRRPLVLSPQTIGPFARHWARGLALGVMRRAAAVATRDGLSACYAREMGLTRPIVEASDVALRLAYAAPEPRRGGRVRVGINVSGLLFNGGYTRDNMFALRVDYAALMRSIIDYFQRQANVEVHLIGHVQSETRAVEDDQRACQALAAEFPAVVVAPRFAHPSHAKSHIAAMDYFVGARMHACLAAFSTGVPLLPMAYSRKVEGFFGSLGYGALADCRRESEAEILTKVQSTFADRDRLKAEMDAAHERALARLGAYESALTTCLGMASHRREAG